MFLVELSKMIEASNLMGDCCLKRTKTKARHRTIFWQQMMTLCCAKLRDLTVLLRLRDFTVSRATGQTSTRSMSKRKNVLYPNFTNLKLKTPNLTRSTRSKCASIKNLPTKSRCSNSTKT